MTSTSFDRNAAIRDQTDQLDRRLISASSRILVAVKGLFLGIDNRPHFFSYQQLITQGWIKETDKPFLHEQFCYLGQSNDQRITPNPSRLSFVDYFVWIAPTNTQFNTSYQQDQLSFEPIDLRKAAMINPEWDVELMIYATGLVNWHYRNAFCGKCGYCSQISSAGHSRVCQNPECKQVHFPKIEPAVICSIESVINSENNLLLARQPSWPDKRYSVIAGFSEVGETLEATVKREAMEEVGLLVENIQYVASQPWPFPSSLMLAFSCETKQQSIRLLDKELEHADWFSANKLEKMVQKGDLLLPFAFSVSWRLIDQWYQKETGKKLQDLVIH